MEDARHAEHEQRTEQHHNDEHAPLRRRERV
jgi:hypothetical protein